jgi:caulimovirus viroplasmin
MAKNNYYAVRIGKTPGIYKTWEDCKAQVIGYKGAIYKGFAEKQDAEDFLRGGLSASSTDAASDNDENPQVEPSVSEITAYVDGSFSSGKSFGCGCIILKDGEIIAEISKAYEDEELATMRNVAGEIKASELAMQYALDNGYTSLSIYHDYQGIASWCLGEWKTNKAGTIAYKQFYDDIKDKLKVHFIKVKGHSGDEYNEIADRLAKKALGIE